jgi:hypothetical protein
MPAWTALASTCRFFLSSFAQEQKMSAKKKSLFLKVFKILKAKDQGCMISIPEAVSMVVGMLGNAR